MKKILSILLLALMLVTALPARFASADGVLKITSPEVLPSGVKDKSYSYKFTATGGQAPYRWETTVPTSGQSYRCCLIGLSSKGLFKSASDYGMPDAGTYAVGVKVVDSTGQSATGSFLYTIKDRGTKTKPKSGKYFDSKVETVSGDMISGWAYDNDKQVTVTLALNSVNAGRVTSHLINVPVDKPRPEIGQQISEKFKIGGVSVPLGFEYNPQGDNIKPGKYRIQYIQYNGKDFKKSSYNKKVFTIK